MRHAMFLVGMLTVPFFAWTTFGTASSGSPDPTDAGTLATDAGDATTPDATKPLGPFCASAGPVSFCDEFDRQTAQGDWTRASQTAGSTLAITALQSSLQATVPELNSETYARLEKDVPRAASSSRIVLEMEIAFDTQPLTPTQVMAVQFSNLASFSLVLLPAAPNGTSSAFVAEQTFGASAGAFNHPSLMGFGAGSKPQRIRLTLELGSKRVKLDVDGAQKMDEALKLEIPSTTLATGIVGIVYSNPSRRFDLRVRNVVFDVK